MPVDLFDIALPAGLAIATLFLFGGLFALGGKRSTKKVGTLLLLFSGIAFIFVGVDYNALTEAAGAVDSGLSILLVMAGVAIFFFAIWDAFK